MKRGALVSAAATPASAQSDKLAKTKLRIRQSSPQLAPSRSNAAERTKVPQAAAPSYLGASRVTLGGAPWQRRALRQTRRRNKASRGTLSFLRFDQNRSVKCRRIRNNLFRARRRM